MWKNVIALVQSPLTSHQNRIFRLQKRDAYKRKCLEIHESYKQLVEEMNRRETKLQLSRQQHTAELQQLLAQLSEAESDKTALMQRQIELGFLQVFQRRR